MSRLARPSVQFQYNRSTHGWLGCMPKNSNKTLLGLDIQELTDIVHSSGEPGYRARQVFQAIYVQRVLTMEAVSTLPATLRGELARQYVLGVPRITAKFASHDGTIRYLVGLEDGESVEAVWMPHGDGGEAGDGSDAATSEETGKT